MHRQQLKDIIETYKELTPQGITYFHSNPVTSVFENIEDSVIASHFGHLIFFAENGFPDKREYLRDSILKEHPMTQDIDSTSDSFQQALLEYLLSSHLNGSGFSRR